MSNMLQNYIDSTSQIQTKNMYLSAKFQAMQNLIKKEV